MAQATKATGNRIRSMGLASLSRMSKPLSSKVSGLMTNSTAKVLSYKKEVVPFRDCGRMAN